ncbi:MAG: uracil-DNA glycosylase [Candidatus Nitrotoga sp.]|nr:uracil-DNA glycosylase [Candidatus Nitrotoga sp.]MDO9448315.1 uracil-DNA glycosylase [Candidatus Nitrotoga sp.]MDP3496506.1 uracil-DNA glycosylase [Candidatus Nitrotoga sp.]
MEFSTACHLCPRLVNFLGEVRQTYLGYYARPVPSFGDAQARFLIVGLAPGMHGANRTGRPFTGDFAGKLLYSTLHQFGFASQSEPLNGAGHANTELVLSDCRVTNAVRCLPPQNKPEPAEVRQCNQYLVAELASLPLGAVVLALGAIAHLAVLRALDLKIKDYKFSHGIRHALPNGIMLYDSYHCSRYNTQTKRLTEAMFHAVFSAIVLYLHSRDLNNNLDPNNRI